METLILNIFITIGLYVSVIILRLGGSYTAATTFNITATLKSRYYLYFPSNFRVRLISKIRRQVSRGTTSSVRYRS